MNGRLLFVSWWLAFAGFTCAVSTAASSDWDEFRAAFERDDCATVIAASPNIIAKYKDYAPAFYLLGVCELRTEMGADAVTNLRRAAELDRTNSTYALALSQALVSAGGNDEAFTLLSGIDGATIPDSQRTPATLLLARAALGCDRVDEAIAALSARLAGDEGSAGLHRALGRAYHQQGSRELAAAELARAWELDPRDTASARTAVILRMALARDRPSEPAKLEQYRQALGLAEKLAQAQGDHANLLLAGEAALAASEFEAASQWFEQAHAATPENALASLYLGQALSAQGKSQRALEVLSAALESCDEPELGARIHSQLGRILACRLELEQAADHYRLAGQPDRADQIAAISQSSRGALEQLAKLRRNLETIRGMEGDLAKIGEQDGVTAMQQRAAALEQDIKAIEKNLADVRAALCL